MNINTSISYIVFLATLLLGVSQAAFFLDGGLGLKGMQMGGAFSANPSGSDAIYWNIAAASQPGAGDVFFMAHNGFDDISESEFMVTLPLNKKTAVSVAYYLHTVGNNERRDSTGALLDTFSFLNEAFFVGYSQSVAPNQWLGATVKVIKQAAVEKSEYLAIDLAYKTKLVDWIDFGAVAQDIYASDPDNAKPICRVGISVPINAWLFNADVLYAGCFGHYYLRMGIAYTVGDSLSLKAGYDGYNQNVYSGLSYKIMGLEADYLYENTDLGVSHKLGFNLPF